MVMYVTEVYDMFRDAPSTDGDNVETGVLLLKNALPQTPSNPIVPHRININLGKHARVSCAQKNQTYPNNFLNLPKYLP